MCHPARTDSARPHPDGPIALVLSHWETVLCNNVQEGRTEKMRLSSSTVKYQVLNSEEADRYLLKKKSELRNLWRERGEKGNKAGKHCKKRGKGIDL